MIVRRPLLAALALCAGSSPALAQLSPEPDPGLWETRTRMTVNGRDMLADMRTAQEAMMKSLPPAGLSQMAEAMKGSRAWTSVYSGKGQSQGRPMDLRAESSGRWLAASCGAVQPQR